MPEFEELLSALETHREPGKWVVAVGPTTVVSMFNMSAVTETAITQQSRAWAEHLASGHSGYGELATDVEKRAWVDAKARGADAWNRGIEAGVPLVAAVGAFHGILDAIAYSDDPKAVGKNYYSSSKCGRVVRHLPTVKGYLAMAEGFQKGSTDDLEVDASRLAKMVSLVHKKAPALHMTTSCWAVVTLDFRAHHSGAKRAHHSGAKRGREMARTPVVDTHILGA
jgi:hypothetical protein